MCKRIGNIIQCSFNLLMAYRGNYYYSWEMNAFRNVLEIFYFFVYYSKLDSSIVSQIYQSFGKPIYICSSQMASWFSPPIWKRCLVNNPGSVLYVWSREKFEFRNVFSGSNTTADSFDRYVKERGGRKLSPRKS